MKVRVIKYWRFAGDSSSLLRIESLADMNFKVNVFLAQKVLTKIKFVCDYANNN